MTLKQVKNEESIHIVNEKNINQQYKQSQGSATVEAIVETL